MFIRRFIVVLVLSLCAQSAFAEVKLPALFADHMVLQRDMNVPIWGFASPGEKVTVTIDDQTAGATADKQGDWRVTLKPLKLGEPRTVTIRGASNTLTLHDVLVGDVWLCSGQSNMSKTVSYANNAKAEIAAANHPQIRLLHVPAHGAQEPAGDVKATWMVCSPQTVGGFSGVGYYFGRDLQKAINIPVGLIECDWGGSACESWIDRPTLDADSYYKPLMDHWRQIEKTFDWKKELETYHEREAKWKQAEEKAKAAGKHIPTKPRAPRNLMIGQYRPANCYNGMLAPLIGTAIRGTIWYQGEHNASRAYQYRKMLPLMIHRWRQVWGEGDFPFYIVQLPNFMKVRDQPVDSAWAEQREAQAMTAHNVDKAYYIVTIDLGEADNIHPHDKQDVGKRLSLKVLKHTYGRDDVIASGPTYKSMKIEGDRVIVSFDHVAGGLVVKGGSGAALKGFALAGADRKWAWADAKVVGNTVVLASPQVSHPVAVRYAWADNPVCNLYNTAELPAAPFRTDDWPGVTVHREY